MKLVSTHTMQKSQKNLIDISNDNVHIVTCISNYRRGFKLDDWIYYTLYIHTTRDYRQYSAIGDIHNLQFTITHGFGSSVFTSHILANGFKTVSLSLQITLGFFFSQSNSSLAIILYLPHPKT
jgi:hypothetical protein